MKPHPNLNLNSVQILCCSVILPNLTEAKKLNSCFISGEGRGGYDSWSAWSGERALFLKLSLALRCSLSNFVSSHARCRNHNLEKQRGHRVVTKATTPLHSVLVVVLVSSWFGLAIAERPARLGAPMIIPRGFITI